MPARLDFAACAGFRRIGTHVSTARPGEGATRTSAYLQPGTNTGLRKCGLRYALDGHVNYSLDRQDSIGDLAESVRDLGRSGNLRLAFLHQLLHVQLSLSRVVEVGRDVAVRSDAWADAENRSQRFYIRSDKVCIVPLEAVVRGVPESLGCRQGSRLLRCGFGRRQLGFALGVCGHGRRSS